MYNNKKFDKKLYEENDSKGKEFTKLHWNKFLQNKNIDPKKYKIIDSTKYNKIKFDRYDIDCLLVNRKTNEIICAIEAEMCAWCSDERFYPKRKDRDITIPIRKKKVFLKTLNMGIKTFWHVFSKNGKKSIILNAKEIIKCPIVEGYTSVSNNGKEGFYNFPFDKVPEENILEI